MILRDSLLRRNIAERTTLLLIVASHVYKDDAWASCVTLESAFFRNLLGVRAFGTQLLCEQVIGRALRRQSYDLNEHNLFNAEYADVLGIPFDFTAARKARRGEFDPRRARC